NRQGLETIVSGATELSSQHSLSTYSQSVLAQLRTLISDDISAVFCARGQGIIENIDDLSFYVLAQMGFDDNLINQKIDTLQDHQASKQVKACYLQQKHQYLDDSLNLYVAKGDYRAVIHVKIASPLTEIQTQLLNVFLTGVAVGYENVHLFQKLTNAAYRDWLTNLP
ncbi:MAG TPA: diguanylate phosphodiesterase, partial [Colwellia sp.]|nr:diguanylate phosphodiesterase [Colwellia sp.]